MLKKVKIVSGPKFYPFSIDVILFPVILVLFAESGLNALVSRNSFTYCLEPM
jgi:hypothetical protein